MKKIYMKHFCKLWVLFLCLAISPESYLHAKRFGIMIFPDLETFGNYALDSYKGKKTKRVCQTCIEAYGTHSLQLTIAG